MDDVVTEVTEARRFLVVALETLSRRRDQHKEAEELKGIVGTLHAMLERWERERARWR